MQRRVHEAHAFVGQYISISRVGELGFAVSRDVIEKARQLLSALIADVRYAGDIEITASQIDGRCKRHPQR